MLNGNKLQTLKIGIWFVTATWAAFDIVWLFANVPIDSELFLQNAFFTAMIPVFWWIARLATGFMFHDFFTRSAPGFWSMNQHIFIYFFGFSALVVLAMKILIHLAYHGEMTEAMARTSGQESGVWHAVYFLMCASLGYFSLLYQSQKR